MPTEPQPELALRIVVDDPVPGVRLRLQRGRSELVSPTAESATEVAFDFTVRVELRGPRGAPNFLGPFTQGPPAARFVYVNVGQSAGQHDSPWSRRAKIPLTEISAAHIKEALESGARLEVHYDGRGRDGGPTCATVRLPAGAWQLRRGKRRS
jgi:hypothetical protein